MNGNDSNEGKSNKQTNKHANASGKNKMDYMNVSQTKIVSYKLRDANHAKCVTERNSLKVVFCRLTQ